MILTMGTPRMVPVTLGNPHIPVAYILGVVQDSVYQLKKFRFGSSHKPCMACIDLL